MLPSRMPPAIEAIIAYLQKDSRFVQEYDVVKLFRLWGNYVERISFFNRYPEMTDHGQLHINNIVTIVAQMILPRLTQDSRKKGAPPFMSRSELFCLVAGAWLHDIGMYETFDKQSDDPMYIRKVHGRLGMEKMFRERNLLFPGLHRDDVRLIGTLAAYHQSRAPLDQAQAEELARLGTERVEGLGTLEDVVSKEGFRDHLTGIGPGEPVPDGDGRRSEQVRPKFIASIIRLADQCDVQMTRSGNVSFMVRQLDRARSHLRANQEIVKVADPDSPAFKRAQAEVDYFGSSVSHFMRNFWVERVLILGDEIVIKMADQQTFIRELKAVAKLGKFKDAIREIVASGMGGVEEYFEKAKKYIEGDYNRIQGYLAADGLKFSVRKYDADRHRPIVADATFIREARVPALPEYTIVAKDEAERVATELHENPALSAVIVYGPSGRSRRPFGREVAHLMARKLKVSTTTSILWHEVRPDVDDQVAAFVDDANSYLARNGEFELENLLRGERLVTQHHVDLLIRTMADTDLKHVIVLDSFNRVRENSRSFFLRLLDELQQAYFVLLTTKLPESRFIDPEMEPCIMIHALGLPTEQERVAAWERSAGKLRFRSAEEKEGALSELLALWGEFGWEPGFLRDLMAIAEAGVPDPKFLLEGFRRSMEARLDVTVSRLGSHAERKLIHHLGRLEQPFTYRQAEALGVTGFEGEAGAMATLVARALVVPTGKVDGPDSTYSLHPAFVRRARQSSSGLSPGDSPPPPPPPPVEFFSGKELKDLGYTGKDIGRIRKDLAEGQANGSITTKEQGLEQINRLAAEGQIASPRV